MNQVLEGVVINGSYNSATATCQVQIGDTCSLFADSGDQAVVLQATLKTTQIGDLYGPVGGERVTVEQCANGWVASYEHADDDTPAPPSGERWVEHRNPQTGAVDAFWKHTNDAAEEGDGLGGAQYGGTAARTRTTTAGGFVIDQNDTTKTATITSPTGHVVTIDDNTATSGVTVQTAGGLISHLDDVHQQINHIAPAVGLGATWSSLAAANNVARNTDLETLASNIVAQTIQTFVNQLLDVFVAQGVPNSALVAAIVQATNWVKDLPGIEPTIPTCSAVVRGE
jgi:hypothetical protein